MNNRPFPTDSYRASKKLEHVHSDVKSFPIHSWPSKYKYFVTIYDDYSSYAWVMLIKTKDQVFKAFKEIPKIKMIGSSQKESKPLIVRRTHLNKMVVQSASIAQ